MNFLLIPFSLCSWEYFGGGWDFAILVGPVYIFVFTVSGFFSGWLADNYNRKKFLAAFITLWSCVTMAMAAVATSATRQLQQPEQQ